MPNKILIVHGWSDDEKSFIPLKKWLVGQGRKTTDVFLSRYASMQDDVTFDDLAAGVQARLEGPSLRIIKSASTRFPWT
jgi:hypothetical protein